MDSARLTGLGLAICSALALALPGPAAVGDPAPSASSTTHNGTSQGASRLSDGPDRGTWRVRTQADRTHRVTWTSPTRLPVTGARPEVLLDGHPVGPATVARDGRTVVATMTGTTPSVESLDVLLSGQVLDEAGRELGQPRLDTADGSRRIPAPLLEVDPGVPGDLEITSSDYTLPSFSIPRMPAPVEMVGHVVRPADDERVRNSPLVLFLHGRHDFCYDPDRTGRFSYRWPCRRGTVPVPSQLGYDYVQRLLASQGFTTVSVAANGINAQDFAAIDGGASARSRLVRRHLRQWAAWVADGTYDVDMGNVVLVGHSRGGEGVNRATLETSAGAPYRVSGQVLLAPTNFARQTAAYVPTVTVLPYCDGDVVDLQGQSYTDLARDLTRDDTALKSSVLVMGANHNFFNTEWTPGISAAPSFDDFGVRRGTCGKQHPDRLSAAQQRAVGKAYIAGAVHLLSDHDPRTLAMFDGTHGRVDSAGDTDVRTHAVRAGRVMRRPGAATALAPTVGATTRICSGHAETRRARACGGKWALVKAPHWVPAQPPGIPTIDAFEMSWTAAGQRGGLVFDRPLDGSDASSLDLRTIVDPRLGGVRVSVRLVDADGQEATVLPDAGGRVPTLPRGRVFFVGKLLAQTLRVPLADVDGIDLSRIAEVDLVGQSPDGHVWVLDIAAVPSGALPRIPDKRLPLVSLGTARITEGDAPGRSVAEVPFRLRSPAQETGRFVVVGLDPYAGQSTGPRVVTVVEGQSEGTIRFDYRANDIDDLRRRGLILTAFPLRNLMTRAPNGQVVIIDDDPHPTLRIERDRSRVVEGRPMTWSVRLSERVGYDLFVEARATRSPRGPRLSVGDVPARFLERHGVPVRDRSRPLHRARLLLFTVMPAGRTSAEIRIPTRKDRLVEGRETVGVRFRSFPFGGERNAVGRVRDNR